jgi:hypothetical protein
MGYDDYHDRIDEYRREEYRRDEYRRDDARYDQVLDESRRDMYADWDRQDAERAADEQTTRFCHALGAGDTTAAMDALGLGLEYREAQEEAAAVTPAPPNDPALDFLEVMQESLDLSAALLAALARGDLAEAEQIQTLKEAKSRRLDELTAESQRRLRDLFGGQ